MVDYELFCFTYCSIVVGSYLIDVTLLVYLLIDVCSYLL